MTVLSLLGNSFSSHKLLFCLFINPFILHEEPAWWIISNLFQLILFPVPKSLTFFFHSTVCCISHWQAFLTHISLHAFLSPSFSIIAMLISDIRMKSRGINLPKSQSAASRLAHHTDQHPGITRLITMSALFSLIVIIHLLIPQILTGWSSLECVTVSFSSLRLVKHKCF